MIAPWREWSDEDVERMLKLKSGGNSASQIAAAMGGMITRNAVVGKLHRLAKQGKAAITPPKPAPAPKPAALKQPYLSETKPAAKLIDVSLSNIHFTERGRTYNKCAPSNFAPRARAKPKPLHEPKPLRVALMDLTSKTCRWPIGEVGAADFCFCGHPPSLRYGAAGPYCEYHERAAYAPLQERKAKAPGYPALPNFSGLPK